VGDDHVVAAHAIDIRAIGNIVKHVVCRSAVDLIVAEIL
jgi:hypothetical protein